MAEKAKEIRQEDCPVIGANEKVRLVVPKIPQEKDQTDLFVSVNGKNYLIQRGKPVTVPRNVKEVVEASLKKSEAADAFFYAVAAKMSASE